MLFSHIVATHLWWVVTCFIALAAFLAGAFFLKTMQRADLLKKQRISIAKEHLEKLRKQECGYSGWATHLQKDVEETIYTFDEIGTKADELIALGRRLCLKERCICTLQCLRDGYQDYAGLMRRLQEMLKEAELTLDDIGSNQAEFDNFPKHVVSLLIRRNLWVLRENYPAVQNAIEWIRSLAEKEVVSLATFGLSDDEKALPALSKTA